MSIWQMIKVLPLLPIAWFSAIVQRNKSIALRYRTFSLQSKRLLKVMGYNLHVYGQENIPSEGAILFVSNHQGTLDPVPIIASCPYPLAFISKKKNEKLPIFGRIARVLDVIHFDHETREGNVYMLREAARRLKQGRRLLIFPEGTRSRHDAMNPFKAGALQPAFMAKATIVPITLNNAYCIDDKKDKNKDISVTFGTPITYEMYQGKDKQAVSDYIYQQIEKNIIYKEA
ncbi:hypothetical protein A4S06_02810 [Erysipelotrichaceae bacterium MTC7]|nr:hypothetical protein A4S06_02810 [Erysipelotrichaceae bacterium MTC7]